MLAKRIIPCLDVKDGKVVKGRSFDRLKYAGNPVALAKKYNEDGADELVLLDITASYEKRKIMAEAIRKVAKQIFIPLTAGGGIDSIEDMRNALNAGADKVSINTAAVKNPKLIRQAAEIFGSQCIVVAIDAKKKGRKWEVYIEGGRKAAGLDAVKWAKKAAALGAGEILLTSIDKDGGKRGYDIGLTRLVSESVNVPVIASGGAGSLADIKNVFEKGKADAALGASIFHYGKFTIKEAKKYLFKKKVEVRL